MARTPYALHGSVPAMCSRVKVIPVPLSKRSTVVSIEATFPAGVGHVLQIYPLASTSNTKRSDGIDEWQNGTVLLVEGDSYLTADGDSMLVQVSIEVPAGTFLGVRVVNLSVSSVDWSVVFVVEGHDNAK